MFHNLLPRALALLLLISASSFGAVIDSVNESSLPPDANWAGTEIGWLYTAPFDYVLAGVSTRFDFNGIDREITLEIYDDAPLNGGNLLRSTTFDSLQGVFVGGTFAPLALQAGEDYFVGFRNVLSLGVNVTDEDGAEQLPAFFGDVGFPDYGLPISSGLLLQPILRFEGPETDPIPEPSTVGLLGLGTLALFAVRRRRS